MGLESESKARSPSRTTDGETNLPFKLLFDTPLGYFDLLIISPRTTDAKMCCVPHPPGVFDQYFGTGEPLRV